MNDIVLLDALLKLSRELQETTHVKSSAVNDVVEVLQVVLAQTNDKILAGLLEESRAREQAEQPEAEQPEAEQPQAETYTLDDVRAKVTEVMKADKSKKGSLQALLKSHGADRVSELDESKFALVIDAIEKGAF